MGNTRRQVANRLEFLCLHQFVFEDQAIRDIFAHDDVADASVFADR